VFAFVSSFVAELVVHAGGKKEGGRTDGRTEFLADGRTNELH
jgi:hypothetical protein